MKRFLANWELKIMAILSAVIFWFLVIGTENTFYTFPDAVPVKAFNLANDLVVSGDLPKVSLRLKINGREAVKNLNVDDFSAFVDLEGQNEGEVTARIEVSSKISDIAVVKVDPSTVKVKIEKISEKEVPIGYEISGDVAEGFQVKEVLLSKENIIVRGSQNALNKVSKATALISLNRNRDDLKITVPLIAYDGDDNIMSDIRFSEAEVEATVLISPFRNQKILGVQPNVVGSPDSSFWIKSVNVNPSYIVAEGDQQLLENLEFVSTQEINVEGIKENKTFTVSILNLPEGVEVENGSISVYIEVQSHGAVGAEIKQKTLVVPMTVKKFKSVQRESEITPSSLNVIVEGKQEDLDKISDSLKMELDISGISQSGGTLNIDGSNLDLPSGVNIVSLTPKVVTATWSQ